MPEYLIPTDRTTDEGLPIYECPDCHVDLVDISGSTWLNYSCFQCPKCLHIYEGSPEDDMELEGK
jgi:ssDNA-binding Zn-finger/Zn-ribbon topoisomerase 1